MRLFSLFLTGAVLLFAQATGRVTGTVVDASGLGVPRATVSLTVPGGSRAIFATTASNDGIFRFGSIPPQPYDLVCEATGFAKSIVRGIKVDAGLELSLKPVKLEIASQSQTVEVTAESGGVQTENATVTNSLTGEQIRQLPSLDRGLQGLLLTQPGITTNSRAETTINGLRPSFTNITFDGINIQDNYLRGNALDFLPNMLQIDQAAEVTISTSNTDASDGNGAAQVKVAPRSGTNQLHGRLIWNNRNNAVAANDWFANRSGLPRLFLNQNVAGGSLLGPIKKDRLFYSLNFEAVRTREKSQQNRTILRGPARQGIFSYRDAAGTLRQTNILTLRGLAPDAAIRTLLADTPPESAINRADFGDGLNTGGYSFAANANRDRNNGTARVDWILSPKHTVHGTLAINNDVVDRPDIGTDYVAQPKVRNDNLTKLLSLTYRWSPAASLTNEARFGFNLAPGLFTTTQQFGSALFGLPLVDNPVNGFQPQGRYTNTWIVQDNASWIRGKHLVRFGYQSQRVRVNSFDSAGTIPEYGLGIAARNRLGLLASDLPGVSSLDLDTANGLLALLGGIVENSGRTFNVTSRTSGFVANAPFDRNFSLDNHSLYAADQWKITNRLSLSVGARWEYFTPVRERDGLWLLPVLEGGDPVRTLLNPRGRVDFAGDLYRRDRNNFAPNVGLAWQPFANGRTVIRAGYSVNFVNDEFIPGSENSALTNQGLQGFAGAAGLNGRASSPPVIPVPRFVVPRTYAQNFEIDPSGSAQAMPDPNLRTPYVQQWNFGIQREIGRGVLEVRYVGNRTTKAWRGIDYNQVVIRENGFLADFQRAQNNGNLARARNGVFNPNFSPNIPGSQRLTVFPLLEEGGFLGESIVRQLIDQGQAGHLAWIYKINELQGDVSFYRNENAYGTNLMTNYSRAAYHALQMDFTRRFSNGLAYQAYYAFSKILSDADGRSDVRFEPFLDFANQRIERARTSFDQNHTFKLNAAYELPFGKGKRFQMRQRAVNSVMGGWTLSGSSLAFSGSPFSVVSQRGTVNRGGRSGNNTANTALTKPELDGFFTLRSTGDGPVFVPANATGSDGRAVAPDGRAPFSGQVFFHPGAGSNGGLQRRMFSGPVFWSTDLALTKTVQIRERHRAEFRAESFNFTNSPSFFVGDQLISSPNFGKIRSTQSARRVMQFGLVYSF